MKERVANRWLNSGWNWFKTPEHHPKMVDKRELNPDLAKIATLLEGMTLPSPSTFFFLDWKKAIKFQTEAGIQDVVSAISKDIPGVRPQIQSDFIRLEAQRGHPLDGWSIFLNR